MAKRKYFTIFTLTWYGLLFWAGFPKHWKVKKLWQVDLKFIFRLSFHKYTFCIQQQSLVLSFWFMMMNKWWPGRGNSPNFHQSYAASTSTLTFHRNQRKKWSIALLRIKIFIVCSKIYHVLSLAVSAHRRKLQIHCQG